MNTFKRKKWMIPDPISEKELEEIVEHIKCSSLFAKVLASKFGKDLNRIDDFLSSDLSQLKDPFIIKDLEKGAMRVISAIHSNERICVYGDFDMDGLTATALLYTVLQELGADVLSYIPDRIDEGYGISQNALQKLIEKGVSVVISVDCGIKSNEEVSFLKKNKVDMIITDHHEPGIKIPDAYAVINTKLNSEDNGLRELAGVGIAFKLAHGILKIWKESKKSEIDLDLRWLLDFVAIGTIADVVPLTGENRILVKSGMKILAQTRKTGLQYVMERCNIKKSINPYHVAFLIAPRFNAAGRLGKAEEALELLLTNEILVADKLSLKMEEYNEERKNIEQLIMEEADSMMKESVNDFIAVLEKESWHTGVIGIVASKLSEKWKKPVILIGSEKENRRGSGRSFGDFNLIEALDQMSELFQSFGGHKAAAGLSIEEKNISQLKSRLNDYAGKCSKDIFMDKLFVASICMAKDLNIDNINELSRMQPFGFGNPQPVFLIKNMQLISTPKILKQKHVSFRFKKDDMFFSAIWFSGKEYLESQQEMIPDTFYDIAFQPDINDYYSPPRLSLKIVDMAASE